MKWKNTSSGVVSGKPKKNPDNPHDEAIYHHKLGKLSWELDDGTIVVCRSYKEYRQDTSDSVRKESNKNV